MVWKQSLANELAMIGMYHFMNAEQEKATTFLKRLSNMIQICLPLMFA